ncbi:MAG: hypothetical protein HOO06_10640 [Bdellovibrionaceae bacterium]|jgi:hypothetical protein|nr:hypothetical protein [Pseudobdellovibrionaceae bacterium]
MKKLTLILSIFLLSACASDLKKRNEVKDLDTKLESGKKVAGDDTLGIRDNTMVVQKKVELAEELRRLENLVYGMEYEVYGNREYGTVGLYGVYRDCKGEVNSTKFGGSGKLIPVEPPAPVIKEERDLKFGKDEKGNLVGISEEYLSERIDRFKKYRKLLRKRRQEYETKVRICENNLKDAKFKLKDK